MISGEHNTWIYSSTKQLTEIKDMESSWSSSGRNPHVTFGKLRIWDSFDPKSICKINSLNIFPQIDVYEGVMLLDCNLKGSVSFGTIRAAD